jgi:FtsH-binding integral membrane protein
MQQDIYTQRAVAGASSVALREAVYRVFFWMAFGVGVTALVAMAVASSQTLRDAVIGNNAIFFLCVIAQLGIVIAFQPLSQRLSAPGVSALFLGYSALTGLIFSIVFVAYTKESIASTFFITAGTFAATAVYGATTKRDLTSVGTFAFMALIGLILVMVVNIFLQSPAIVWITSLAGIAIFVALTAYDMQKVKQSAGAAMTPDQRERWAVSWALRLYLDFINLFLFILRFTGSRR